MHGTAEAAILDPAISEGDQAVGAVNPEETRLTRVVAEQD